MIVNNVNLAAVGVKFSQYPTDNKPEVAFAGKSNVIIEFIRVLL